MPKGAGSSSAVRPRGARRCATRAGEGGRTARRDVMPPALCSGQWLGEVLGGEPPHVRGLEWMGSQLAARGPAVEDERVQGDSGEPEAQSVENGDEADHFRLHPGLLEHLLHHHLGCRVTDVGPPGGIEPHAGVGALH
jgi:hypothetical protein